MKKVKLIFFFLMILIYSSSAQTASTFHVGGDLDKYYPVSFNDAGFYINKATTINIGRSHVHTDDTWRGSLISSFSYHVTNYGHGSSFIDAEIRSSNQFIAGWKDATGNNGSNQIIIWFKGGGNTYYLTSEFNINPVVYDGVQQALPFQEERGPAHSFKTQLDEYVINYASIKQLSAYYTGNGFFKGDVGIGTADPKGYKLAVNGKIRAQEIKVEIGNWPDYVFAEDYKKTSLEEIEKYISLNKRLPEMPSALEVQANGVELGDINKKLLRQQEEFVLHLIEKDKEIKALKKDYEVVRVKLDEIITLLNKKIQQ